MTDDERFSDEEASLFFECEEREAAIRKALRCTDPRLREIALAVLAEEMVHAVGQFAEETLAAADDGEIALSAEGRECYLEVIEVAIDRPDWYSPGDRVLLPDE